MVSSLWKFPPAATAPPPYCGRSIAPRIRTGLLQLVLRALRRLEDPIATDDAAEPRRRREGLRRLCGRRDRRRRSHDRRGAAHEAVRRRHGRVELIFAQARSNEHIAIGSTRMWILISNLDQPAFQGHEAEKDLAELCYGAKRVGLSYHFRFAARSRPL